MDNKKVWIINHDALPPSMGGLNRHYYFAKDLISRGYDVSIFTSSFIHNSDINMISKEEKVKFKEIDVEGVKYTYIKGRSYVGSGLTRIRNILEFMFDISKIRKYKKGETPGVIYSSSPNIFTLIGACLLAKKMKVPFVSEVRDLWPLSIVEYKGISEKSFVIKTLYKIERWIYKNANACIFTMPGGAQYIKDKGWDDVVNLDKVFNINNGVDVPLQEEQREKFTVNDSMLDDNSFKVVYTGSIRQINRVDKIIDIADIIKQKGYDIKFLIYGRGDYEDILKEQCKERNITNVYFKGYVDNKYIPYICSKSSVNLADLSNRNRIYNYGLSMNKMYSYLNAGKPIVSRQSSYDLLDEEQCGISVKSDECEDFANAIIEIYNMDKAKYDNMCINAHNAVKKYDFKILTDKLETVFEYASISMEENNER